jgi:lipoyl-dependent peroxiredoxin
MATRHAEATWEGELHQGKGMMKLGDGFLQGEFSFGTRMQEEPGTNPEELIGAAHAGCFSMALAAALGKAGHAPQRIHTKADVHLDKVGEGFKITKVRLRTEAAVPGLDEAKFRQHAEAAKKNCPVSQALAGTNIELEARLTQEPKANAPEKEAAAEWGERIDTGKAIARGGKTTGHVPGAMEHTPTTSPPKKKGASGKETPNLPPLRGDAVL